MTDNKDEKIVTEIPGAGAGLNAVARTKPYITVLSVLACLAVVLIHTDSCNFWDFDDRSTWVVANIVESLCYFAVPVFFMITGANLIDYPQRYDAKTYATKRLMRTVVPLAIWLMIALVVNWLLEPHYYDDYDLPQLLNLIFNPPRVGMTLAYWFFFYLFAIYLAIPLFAAVPDDKKQKVFGYLIVAALALNFALPLLCKIIEVDYNSAIALPACGGYLAYPLIGYYLDHYTLGRKGKIAIYVAGAVGLLTLIVGTHVLSFDAGYINDILRDYHNVPAALYGSAIFLAFQDLGKTKFGNILFRCVKPLGECTLGVFLLHALIIDLVYRYTPFLTISIFGQLLIGVLIFAFCMAVVKLVLLIPYVRIIFGKPTGTKNKNNS